jgi:dTMP kinase
MEGKFIVLEGIDGSGTTTVAGRMHAALLDLEVPVHVTEEPSQGPIGSLIRQVLHGRFVSTGFSGQGAPSWSTMALLFGADRLDHLESEIVPNLSDGINVISDRYIHSSLVYQTVTSGDDDSLGWIEAVNRFAVTPDIIFFLDVTAEEAQRRRLARRIGHELYEDLPLQQKIAEKYREILGRYRDCRVVMVDAGVPLEEVVKKVLDETRRFMGI